MAEYEEIMDGLAQIAAAKQAVRLINVYKGFPITYEAEILNIDENGVLFKVHRYQALCLWLGNQTYIKTALFPEILRASAIGVDIEEERAMLAHFEFMGKGIGLRRTVRVQPKDTIEVTITARTMRVKTVLADISVHGLAVYLDAFFFNPRVFKIDEEVSLLLHLPDPNSVVRTEVRLNGHIRSVVRETAQRIRIGILIQQKEDANVPELSRYVTLRQAEVLKEIRMLHNSLLRLTGTGSLE